MAETLEAYIENERVGTPIAPSKPPCSMYQSIIELEIDSPKESDFSKFRCNYTMGKSLFLDLRDILGNQGFIQSVRRLYKMRTTPHIESVKSAFPNSSSATRTINRHYYGDPNPQSIEPSPQLPTIKLTSASLHLEREQTLPPWDKTPLRSISASKYHGPIILLVTTPPHGQNRRTQVTLTVKHAESDWGRATHYRTLNINWILNKHPSPHRSEKDAMVARELPSEDRATRQETRRNILDSHSMTMDSALSLWVKP